MDFRFRILFYHENQPWVADVLRMIDVPMFIPIVTDSAEVFESHVQQGNVDMVLTGINTKHLHLMFDEINSMAFKKAPIWQVLAEQKKPCPIILLCTREETAKAIDIVYQGLITNFCSIGPHENRNQILYLTMMKSLEEVMMKQLIQQALLPESGLPKDLYECIEALQTLRQLQAHDTITYSDVTPMTAIMSAHVEETPALAWQKSAEEAMDETRPSFTLNPQEQTQLVEKLTLNGRIETEVPSNNWTRLTKSPYDILLVVPDKETAHTVTEIFAPDGIKVLTVTNTEQALGELNKAMFDLMLVGTELPDKPGLDLLRRIRLKGPQSGIDIIMIAERGFENQVLTSMQYGANYFVVKPIDANKLRTQAMAMLNRAHV